MHSFNVLAWADEIGSGVKNMNKYVGVYSGGAHPIFIEGESFKSILPLQVVNVGKHYELYLHLSQLLENQIGFKRIESLKQLVIDLSLKNVDDKEELAVLLSKYWQEKSGELNKCQQVNTGIEREAYIKKL